MSEEEKEEKEEERVEREYITSNSNALPSIIAMIAMLVVGSLTVDIKTISEDFFKFLISFIYPIIAFVLVIGTVHVNNVWEESIILRAGRYKRTQTAGIYVIIPFLDDIIKRDMRVRSTTFTAEDSLTKDNVPVSVDAVLFWRVIDSKKSIIDIQDFHNSIINAAMTTLRDTIGKSTLATLLSDRDSLDTQIKETIDEKAKAWGLDVPSVEIKDVVIPEILQDAMSRQAQAQKEKEARITLSESEIEIAKKFEEASKIYKDNPGAMQLRGLNMLYETIKNDKSTVVVVPSDVVGLLGKLVKS